MFATGRFIAFDTADASPTKLTPAFTIVLDQMKIDHRDDAIFGLQFNAKVLYFQQFIYH